MRHLIHLTKLATPNLTYIIELSLREPHRLRERERDQYLFIYIYINIEWAVVDNWLGISFSPALKACYQLSLTLSSI